MIDTPEMRTKALLHYFGWQGGTIHQLAEETGVEVSILLYGEPENNFLGSETSQGWFANRTCDLEKRLSLVKEHKGDKDFWMGVGRSGIVDFSN